MALRHLARSQRTFFFLVSGALLCASCGQKAEHAGAELDEGLAPRVCTR